MNGYKSDSAARSSSSPMAVSDEEVLRSCLSRLLVVHCSSSSQLLLTLHFLENSLSSRPALALLLIDSISAFYWVDRSEGGGSITKQEERLSKCAELLGRLLRSVSIHQKVLTQQYWFASQCNGKCTARCSVAC